jgi:hypothetical protein
MLFLCRFHQIIYGDLKRRDGQIASENERITQIAAEIPKDDQNDGFMSIQSRALTAIMDMDDDVARTKQLADEYTVIGLWATAEQHLGQVFIPLAAHVNRVPESSVKCSYRWDDFTAGYAPLGIDLKSLHDFADADECRVLNNTIKHSGKVCARLAQYPFFTSHLNLKLFGIQFEMQRYVNAVTHFVGSLIERASRIIDPSFRS